MYYVFEFKCSKVLRIKKSGLGPCLSYKILRIFLLKQQYHALDPWAQNTNFYRVNPLDSPKKLNIIKLSSLSLFLVKYSVLSACSYAFSQFCLHINCSTEMCRKLVPHHNTKTQCEHHCFFACFMNVSPYEMYRF